MIGTMFSTESGKQDLIPKGTLAWALVTVDKNLKTTKEKGGRYANLDLKIIGGPYEGRTIFRKMICDPSDVNNTEKWRDMAKIDLTHAFEACKVFDPSYAASYRIFDTADFPKMMGTLDQKPVAIQIGIEAGTGGHNDRNNVDKFLSPNQNSGTKRQFDILISGGLSAAREADAARTGFLNAAPAPVLQAAPVATATTPFGTPQGGPTQQPTNVVAEEPPAWVTGNATALQSAQIATPIGFTPPVVNPANPY